MGTNLLDYGVRIQSSMAISAEVDLNVGVQGEARVICHLFTAIPVGYHLSEKTHVESKNDHN